jgi:sugar phosphate isomerase/epimerase
MGPPRGIEHLTLLDVAPPDFVTLAAEAGFDAVGLRIAPATDDEQPWPMSPGSPMLAQTVRRCRDTGVTVLDTEAIRLGPEHPVRAVPVLETAAALGARYVNAICDDPDLGRLTDHFAALAQLARPYQIRPVIEPMAYRSVHTLAGAVAIVAGTGGGLVIDALHIQRCGIDLTELAALEPDLIAYLQLCDAPLAAPPDRAGQLAEARTGRLLPGAGELPLARLLAAVPAGLAVTVEAPDHALSSQLGPSQFAKRARHALEDVMSLQARGESS